MPKHGSPNLLVTFSVRAAGFVQDVLCDLRYGYRFLTRNPEFSLAAILALSVGIGANAALLSITYAVLIDPLPYPNADKIVRFIQNRSDRLPFISGPNFRDWRSHQKSFVDLAAYEYGERNLGGVQRPLRATVYRVTPGFFEVLGVRPVRGRVITQDDVSCRVAIISERVWRTMIGRKDISDSVITLDDQSYQIIGVMPEGFEFPYKTDTWIPWDLTADDLMTFRKINLLTVIGRVSKDRSVEDAQRDIDLISSGLAERYPEAKTSLRVSLVSLKEETVGYVRTPLLVLLVAVGLLMLVACIDVANLLLAKGLNRSAEFATRFALGASRLRLIRQLLTENLLLTGLSSVVGFFLGKAGVGWLVQRYPDAVPRLREVQIDYRSALFLVLICVITTAIMGLYPALQNSKARRAGREPVENRVTVSAPARRSQKILLIVQIGLTVCLVSAAAILAKSYWNVSHAPLGYNLGQVLTLQTVLSTTRYKSDEQKVTYCSRAMEAIQQVPGATLVGVANNSTFSNWAFTLSDFQVKGREKRSEQRTANWVAVSGDYFRALEIPIRAGRVFERWDRPGGEPVIVLDERAALQVFGRPNAVGEKIKLWDKWRTIVGVVGNITRDNPHNMSAATIYTPYEQYPTDRVTFIIKMRGPTAGLRQKVKESLAQIDPEQPLYGLQTLEESRDERIAGEWLNSFLMLFFGGAALLLTVCGIYGTMAYQTSRRTGEVGIRIAVGATHVNIFWMLFREGILLTLIGLTIGNLAALALSKYLATMIFRIHPQEPLVYLAVNLIVMFVALSACLVPATRIVRLHPWSCLRYE